MNNTRGWESALKNLVFSQERIAGHRTKTPTPVYDQESLGAGALHLLATADRQRWNQAAKMSLRQWNRRRAVKQQQRRSSATAKQNCTLKKDRQQWQKTNFGETEQTTWAAETKIAKHRRRANRTWDWAVEPWGNTRATRSARPKIEDQGWLRMRELENRPGARDLLITTREKSRGALLPSDEAETEGANPKPRPGWENRNETRSRTRPPKRHQKWSTNTDRSLQCGRKQTAKTGAQIEGQAHRPRHPARKTTKKSWRENQTAEKSSD
jgi:hypothetical protein